MCCFSVRQIEQDFIDKTPAPSFRRIVALDDRMLGGVEMLGRVPVGRIVAAADVAARAADPQMQPLAATLEAFLAAERARRHAANASDVGAAFCQPRQTSLASKNMISAPPLANLGTSAAVALPSALPKAFWTAAMLSKVSVAIR